MLDELIDNVIMDDVEDLRMGMRMPVQILKSTSMICTPSATVDRSGMRNY